MNIPNFNRLIKLFRQFKGEVEDQNSQGFYNINKHAEDIMVGILNGAFGWKLVNANLFKKDQDTFDLSDDEAGVCIQVTSTANAHKIKSTLEQFVEKEYYNQYNTLQFYFLIQKPNNLRNKSIDNFQSLIDGKFLFNVQEHLLDSGDVLTELRKDTSSEKACCVLNILEGHFGGEQSLSVYSLSKHLRKGSQKFYSDLRKNGRFRYLDIVEQLLPQSQVYITEPLVELQSQPGNIGSLKESIETLQEQTPRHVVLVGEGGLGKTVSLLILWQQYLEDENTIPIFIPLNDYNQADDRRHFVRNYIARYYLQQPHPSDTEKNLLWQLLVRSRDEPEQTKPAVLLLLDGFNELTVDKTQLLEELKELIEVGQETQIVAVSRSDMRRDFNWLSFHEIKLTYLPKEKIVQYLDNLSNATYPSSPVLQQLITIPLNLTLYATTSEIIAKHDSSDVFSFRNPATGAGDLLWNYLEAQPIKVYEQGRGNAQVYYYKFALQHVLPYFSYEMERRGQFELSESDLNDSIDRFYKRFEENGFLNDFLKTFPYYRSCEELMKDLSADRVEVQIKRDEGIKELLCKKLGILVQEGAAYRLLHQNFRDFLAALHVYQDILLAEEFNTVPSTIGQSLLSKEVRNYIGELAGEHHNNPLSKLKENSYQEIEFAVTPLTRLIDRLRGRFDEEVKLTIKNVVMIWTSVRGELTEADLSNLYLKDIPFNSVRCYRKKDDTYFGVNFNGSLLDQKDFLPDGGGTSVIQDACYSPDGTKIIYCANNLVTYGGTVDEWSKEICQQVFINEEREVVDICYSPDGKQILSISDDNTFKIWDVSTGECVDKIDLYSNAKKTKTISSDTNISKIVIYSDALNDTIKEWSIATKRCLQPLIGHSRWGTVSRACYSSDGKKLLAGSSDGWIKEWSTETGEGLMFIDAYSSERSWGSRINHICYSPDESKILACTDDGIVTEWRIDSPEKTFEITSLSSVTHINYSTDGSKILFSCPHNSTIQEWIIGNPENVKQTKTFRHGRAGRARYSPDGSRILSLGRSPNSWNENVIEWDIHTGSPIQQITNVVGLYIQGCSFQNLHKDSQISSNLFERHGALVD